MDENFHLLKNRSLVVRIFLDTRKLKKQTIVQVAYLVHMADNVINEQHELSHLLLSTLSSPQPVTMTDSFV